MERINFKQQVWEEKKATQKRLEELQAELSDAEQAFSEAQKAFDADLLSGNSKQTEKSMATLQKATIRVDGLKRVIDDVEGRVLPEFTLREKEAREQARIAVIEELRPIHAETLEKIKAVFTELEAILIAYKQKTNDIESGWGAGAPTELLHFWLDPTRLVRDSLRFEDVLLKEIYRPSAGYQPMMGLTSSMKESR
jgi:hypothetical protein